MSPWMYIITYILFIDKSWSYRVLAITQHPATLLYTLFIWQWPLKKLQTSLEFGHWWNYPPYPLAHPMLIIHQIQIYPALDVILVFSWVWSWSVCPLAFCNILTSPFAQLWIFFCRIYSKKMSNTQSIKWHGKLCLLYWTELFLIY